MPTVRPWTNGSQSGIRGRLVSRDDLNDQLIFQYNPTGIQEQKRTEWAEAQVPGGNDSLDTFASGQSLQLAMQLFFNTYGEGARQPQSKPGSAGPLEPGQWVEEALAFLYRFAEARTTTASVPGRSPGVLLLVLGRMRFPGQAQIEGSSIPVLPVRIAQLNVNRTMFGKDYTTVRATADLTLVRVSGFPR